jgi:LacI family transcriptional regulator
MKNITMADIAKKTGYSVNTVSHALSDKPDISEKTKKYIIETAKSMGYIRNISASALRSGKTKTIAVIIGDISNPHFSVIIKEIESELRKYNYTAIIFNTDEDENLEKIAIISAIEKNVDGIIICPVQKSEENIRFLQKSGVKFTLIGRRFDNIITPYVVCDDKNGGYLAASYFLSNDHENILFINGDGYISSSRERLAGIKKAFKEMNVSLERLRVESVPVSESSNSDKISNIVNRHDDVSAIICFSDLIGMQVCHCLRQKNIDIPQRVSVLGFDNIASRFTFPVMLSSITSSKTTMSCHAVENLMAMINKENCIEQIVLSTTLVLRETTINSK